MRLSLLCIKAAACGIALSLFHATAQASALPHDMSPPGMFFAADQVVKSVLIGLLITALKSATSLHTRGWELEAQYQLGPAYARLSYTRETTRQPTSIASAWFGAADISELPSVYYNLDVGTRLLDNKLEVGAILKHTGSYRHLSPENEADEATGEVVKADNPKIPAVIDLYASYQVSQNLFLRLSVQNAMNKDFSEALNRLNSMPSQSQENTPLSTARGRTYVAGLEYRF